jgi:hypothetical protein
LGPTLDIREIQFPVQKAADEVADDPTENNQGGRT